MAKLKLYAVLALVTLVLIVVLQNTGPVKTRILFATLTMPRAALLALTLLIGVAAGIIISLALTRTKTHKNDVGASDPDDTPERT